jgi:hypothetical protein
VVAIVAASAFAGLANADIQVDPAPGGEPRTGCERGTFADYHDQADGQVPPAGYDGPVFELSQDWPETLPPAEDVPWQDVDVDAMLAGDGGAAEAYLTAAFDYATEGNVEADWVPADNSVRDWYHTPWLDTSADGREFVHGLTHELDSVPLQLGPTQTEVAQTWAVGLYNAPGAWAIGQVWCDPQNPDPSALNPDDTVPNAFPDGTTVVKLLFTTADDEQAPFLEDTFEWTADIFTTPGDGDPDNPDNSGDPPRSLQTVRLIQVDLAVRDTRLPLGWAFGTYAYDSASGAGWDGLQPLGLSWSNAPGVTPTMAEDLPDGRVATGQWLNEPLLATGLEDLHLGWAGRLSGPLDNPRSSCLSCHQTAGSPAAPLVPEASPALAGRELTEAQRLGWFNDLPAGSIYSPDQIDSLDYSLQLTIGLQRFLLATCDPRVADEEVSGRGPDRPAPADQAPALCSELAAAPSSTDDGVATWWLVVAGVGGLALGALIAAWLWRRPRVAP